MSRPARILAALALLAALPAAAADLDISWDRDLAFEYDRDHYERTLRGMVDDGLAAATSWLGIPVTRRIAVRVLTHPHYEASFGDAVWTRGAHYQAGTIHVNGGARLNAWFAAMLAHEMTHAVLDAKGTAHRLPTWLNEGLAVRVGNHQRGWDRLDGVQVNQLEGALDRKTLLPLPTGGITTFGYLQAFAAVLFLEDALGREKLLTLVRRAVERGDFAEALHAEAGWSQRNVDEGFVRWVDHLQ
jgi:hypothetical protein